MASFYDRVKMGVSAAPGTGAVSLGSPVPGYRSFAAAGVADGGVVSYAIEDGAAWEVGHGTYTASGAVLNRTIVIASSAAGAAINADTNAVVYLTLLASDVAALGGSGGAADPLITRPPAAATWTKQNFAAWTLLDDLATGGVALHEVYNSANTQYGNQNSLRAALAPIPDAHFQVTAKLRRGAPFVSYGAYGLVVRDSASSNSMIIGMSAAASQVGEIRFSADTAYSDNQGYNGGGPDSLTHTWWERIVVDGSGNNAMWISYDGVFFGIVRTYQETGRKFGFLANDATHIGFGGSVNNSANNNIPFDVTCLSWAYEALP